MELDVLVVDTERREDVWAEEVRARWGRRASISSSAGKRGEGAREGGGVGREDFEEDEGA